MASLANNALITVKEYLEFLGHDTDDESASTSDTRHIHIINGVSNFLEKYLGRKICPATADNEEVKHGDGEKYLYVNYRPLTTLSAIYNWSGTEWTEWTTADYSYTSDATTGRVWFTDGTVFTSGSDNFKIKYTYGWNRADVPDELKLACCLLVKQQLDRLDAAGDVASQNFGDVTVSYRPHMMSDLIKQLLLPYKRVAFV